MAFPTSPSDGGTYTLGNTQYIYNSTTTTWDIDGTVTGDAVSGLQVQIDDRYTKSEIDALLALKVDI